MKKIDWAFWALVLAPFAICVGLYLLKIHMAPGMSWLLVLSPLIVPVLGVSAIGIAGVYYVALVRHGAFRSKRKKICGNCSHCSLADFGKGKLCLQHKDEVSEAQKGCEDFENRYRL